MQTISAKYSFKL